MAEEAEEEDGEADDDDGAGALLLLLLCSVELAPLPPTAADCPSADQERAEERSV